jgi:hypothetical protein
MALEDTPAKPVDVSELLLSKGLEPLAPEHLPLLEKSRSWMLKISMKPKYDLTSLILSSGSWDTTGAQFGNCIPYNPLRLGTQHIDLTQISRK